MSDTPEARPGLPRPAVKPAAPSAPNVSRPGKPIAPAAPTPRRPLPSVTDAEELQLASSSLMPIADEAKPPPPIPTARRSVADIMPPIPPRPPSSHEIVTSAAPLPTASRVPPSPLTAGREAVTPAAPIVAETPSMGDAGELGDAAQEQLAAILHTVLESTLAPAVAKQKELEQRLETLHRAAAAQSVRNQQVASLAPVRSMAPSVDVSSSFSSGPPAPRASMPSLISTSYGLVSVLPGPAPRPAIEEALERVGPIDMPDFAGKRKFAGGIVVGVLILGVVGAILATILSYS